MALVNRRTMLRGIASVGLLPGTRAFGQGRVVMRLVGREVWSVYKPDGSVLDTKGSKTSGLQEAINYALTNGFELKVIGGAIKSNGSSHHIIRCYETVVFPPMVNARIYFGSVLIHFSPSVTGDGFLFDTVVHSTVECNAYIYYQGNGSALRFWPRTPKTGGGTITIDSKFFFFSVAAVVKGKDFIGVHFDASLGKISHIRFDMVEIEGAAYGPTGPIRPMGDALRITNGFFKGNTITIQRINGFGRTGLRIGENSKASGISNNRYYADIDPVQVADLEKTIGIETWGHHDWFNVTIRSEQEFGAGVVLQPTAHKNKFVILENHGTPPIVDNSKSADSVFL